MRHELSDQEWEHHSGDAPDQAAWRTPSTTGASSMAPSGYRVLPGGTFQSSIVPRTTCYNRFVRWRRAGIWDGIMQALTVARDGAVQMIDTSMVRGHQHAACIADSGNQAVGRSRGGLTSKLHVASTQRLAAAAGYHSGSSS